MVKMKPKLIINVIIKLRKQVNTIYCNTYDMVLKLFCIG